jgi:hypothetical protein
MDFGAPEEWRDIPGYEGRYQVSDAGRVRSLLRTQPLILKPHGDGSGYPRVGFVTPGAGPLRERLRHFRVHRLVAEVFHADKRNALHNEVAHLDGSRTNARADNLKWVSKVENRSHRKIHGTETNGERHGNSKLTEEAVRHIRSTSDSRSKLAALYGVTAWAIDDVRKRRNWRHIV